MGKEMAKSQNDKKEVKKIKLKKTKTEKRMKARDDILLSHITNKEDATYLLLYVRGAEIR